MAEQIRPQHDWIVLKKIEHQELTPGGILVPPPGDYEHMKTDRERRESARTNQQIEPALRAAQQNRLIERYEVLAAGPGSYVDFSDDVHDDVFLRKPVCCAAGDIVLVQGVVPPLPVNGDIVYMAHDYQVMAIIVNAGTNEEDLSIQHDYIFARESAGILTSAGGLHLPGVEVQGNARLPLRFQTLGVGEGPWAICERPGKPTEFARRPMCVAPGDVFTFEGAGFGITTGRWGPMVVVQNFQVAAVFAGAA